MAKSLPDQITDFFVALIFTGAIPAGHKLPPERKLADELEVDRTSLRSALRTLSNMNLTQSLQGSGITVLDYREHAELSFAEHICQIEELEIGSEWLLAASEFIMTVFPSMINRAFTRASPEAIETLRELLTTQLQEAKLGATNIQLAQMEVDIQKHMATLTENPFFMLHRNNMLNLHMLLMSILFESVDPINYLESQLTIVNDIASQSKSVAEAEVLYAEALGNATKPIEEKLKQLPVKSRLRTSPLKHKPRKLSLKS